MRNLFLGEDAWQSQHPNIVCFLWSNIWFVGPKFDFGLYEGARLAIGGLIIFYILDFNFFTSHFGVLKLFHFTHFIPHTLNWIGFLSM